MSRENRILLFMGSVMFASFFMMMLYMSNMDHRYVSVQKENINISKSSLVPLPPKKRIYNPFGIKNPGNELWEGSIESHNDFADFISIEHSIRAFIRILATYQNEWDLHTIEEMFLKYVSQPSHEIEWYLRKIEKDINISRHQKIDLFYDDGRIKNKEVIVELIIVISECESGNRANIKDYHIENGIKLYQEDFINQE